MTRWLARMSRWAVAAVLVAFACALPACNDNKLGVSDHQRVLDSEED